LKPLKRLKIKCHALKSTYARPDTCTYTHTSSGYVEEGGRREAEKDRANTFDPKDCKERQKEKAYNRTSHLYCNADKGGGGEYEKNGSSACNSTHCDEQPIQEAQDRSRHRHRYVKGVSISSAF